MDINLKDLKRNGDVIKNSFQKQGDIIICLDDCKFIFPTRWLNTKLANTENEEDARYIFGAMMVVVGKSYAVTKHYGMIRIGASGEETIIKVNGEDCVQYSFAQGEVVIEETQILKDNNMPYYVTDLIVNKGRVPPYFTKDDDITLYDVARNHTTLPIPNMTYISILVNHRWKSAKDKNINSRHIPKGDKEVGIAFVNIPYNVVTTLDKLNGNYLNQGIHSALINPTNTNTLLSDLIMQ